MGVIRLIVENQLRIPLLELFEFTRSVKRPPTARALIFAPGWNREVEPILLDLLSFFADRLKVHLREQGVRHDLISRSEEHTSELQSLMRISYAVFCLKKTRNNNYTKHPPSTDEIR